MQMCEPLFGLDFLLDKGNVLFSLKLQTPGWCRFERRKEMVCQIRRESWAAGERDIVDMELHQADNHSSFPVAGNEFDPCSLCNRALRQMEVGREEC